MSQLKVEKERMNAEKSGLDLLLKQKNSEIESLTSSYDELASQLKSISQERNRYKVRIFEIFRDFIIFLGQIRRHWIGL